MGSGRLEDGFGDPQGPSCQGEGPWAHGPMGPMGPMGPWAHGPMGPMGPLGPMGPMDVFNLRVGCVQVVTGRGWHLVTRSRVACILAMA